MTETYANFIGGDWVAAPAGFEVENPATATVFALHARASSEDLGRTLEAARMAADRRVMASIAPARRAALLRRVAVELIALRSEGGRLLCLESGKSLRMAVDEFDKAAASFDYFAGLADKIEGRQIPVDDDMIDFTVAEPYGVSLQIVPWNFPVSIASRSVAAALAAGNCVILKSPELTPIGLHLMGRAIERAGLPAGAVSIIAATGADTDSYLTASPLVDQITFTGSVDAGRAVLARAAQNIVPAVVELGGKSAGIALQDARLDRVMAAVRQTVLANAGQICSGMSRLLVHRDRLDEVCAELTALHASMSVGPGLEDHDLTPLISAAQRDRVAAMTKLGHSDGATFLCGGHPIERAGYFFDFTVVMDLPADHPMLQDEIFGPVLCVTPFDEVAEAVQIANETPYGLAAGIFTDRLGDALRMAHSLRAGQIYGNRWHAGSISTPFGGVGRSGYGREKGQEAILNYVRTKNIAFAL